LPTSSTWGNSASPATPTNVPSAWAKPSTSKSQGSSATTAAKKTLADIQREEELRKQKLAAAAAAAAQPISGLNVGKRYSELASKPVSSSPATGSAWATVGAGGKVKVPTGPASVMPQTMRSVSTVSVATASSSRVTRPAPATRSATTTGQSSVNTANEEFTRWAKATLTRGVDSEINGKKEPFNLGRISTNLS